MKILLVSPSWDGIVSKRGRRYNKAWPALELLYIAGFLEKEGIEVRMIDGRADPDSIERLRSESAACDKVFITSSPLDRWECPNLDLRAFKLWTDRLEPEKLFVMGAHGTMVPEFIQKEIPCRAILLGEPEETALDVCRSSNLSQVPGLIYKEGQRWIKTSPRVPIDLAHLPEPAYHYLDIGRYHYEVLGDKFVILEATRGCPYTCTYCSLTMQGNRFRKKPVSQVVRDMQKAVHPLGAETAFFVDLEFTVDRKYTLELCKALQEARLPLRWSCQTRVDTVDEEMLVHLKKAGCQLIHYGVESGSQRILDLIQKRITLDQIRRGVAMTQKAGIEQLCFFMFGIPGETQAEMEMTLQLAKELNPTYASFHVATPYPTTRLYELESANGSLARWGDLGVQLPENYGTVENLKHLRSMESKAYRDYYLRPAYLLHRLTQGDPRSWQRQWKLFWGYAH